MRQDNGRHIDKRALRTALREVESVRLAGTRACDNDPTIRCHCPPFGDPCDREPEQPRTWRQT